jgi:hypothetical protein
MEPPHPREGDDGALEAVPTDRVEARCQLRGHADTDPDVAPGPRAPVHDRRSGIRIVVELGPHVAAVAKAVVADQLAFDRDLKVGVVDGPFEEFDDGNGLLCPNAGAAPSNGARGNEHKYQ